MLVFLKAGTPLYDHSYTKPRRSGVIEADGYYVITRKSRTDYPNGDYRVNGCIKGTHLWVTLEGRAATVPGMAITHS